MTNSRNVLIGIFFLVRLSATNCPMFEQLRLQDIFLGGANFIYTNFSGG